MLKILIFQSPVFRPSHMNGNLLKSPTSFYADPTTKSSLYACSEKDYEDRKVHPSNCDTQDYVMNGGIKSPSYYGDHSPNHNPNLNGVIGNIQFVRAKTEEVSYDGHHLGMKPSALMQQHELDMAMHQDANNNNNSGHIEPFMNLVPPPPHLAAELGRKCMSFNAEQVNTRQPLEEDGIVEWIEKRGASNNF